MSQGKHWGRGPPGAGLNPSHNYTVCRDCSVYLVLHVFGVFYCVVVHYNPPYYSVYTFMFHPLTLFSACSESLLSYFLNLQPTQYSLSPTTLLLSLVLPCCPTASRNDVRLFNPAWLHASPLISHTCLFVIDSVCWCAISSYVNSGPVLGDTGLQAAISIHSSDLNSLILVFNQICIPFSSVTLLILGVHNHSVIRLSNSKSTL